MPRNYRLRFRVMDSRRSSFLIGSRTHKNVLKGKNIRKHDDGADNFADYWTDSDRADISSTEPNASEIKLKTLRQNVRSIPSSSILHSETKVKDKQDCMKIMTSPLKPVKHNILDYDKNNHTCPTKRHKVSSKLQQGEYQDPTISANNVFNRFDQNPTGSECSLTSTISQHSVSVSEVSKKQTEIIATSALPCIRNKVKSSQKSSTTCLTSNYNKKENIELNASHHSPYSLRYRGGEKASPLLPRSQGKKKKMVLPKKSVVSRNLNETFSLPPASAHHSPNSLRDSLEKEASLLLTRSKGNRKKIVSPKKMRVSWNLNETIFPSSASDHNDISTGSLSPISKLSKERSKAFVINENISQANVDPSDIHMFPSVKVISTDTNLTNTAGSEINPLTNKSSHGQNSHIEHEEVSSIFKSGSRNHALMKLRNSSQISKTFAKYDEYDAKIMEMAYDNENSFKMLTTDQSVTLSSPKSTEENEAESNNSESDAEYEETNVVARKKTGGKVKNQNYECVSNNKVLSRSQQKNSMSRDGINTELFQEKLYSDEENFELADIAHTSLHNHKSQAEDIPFSECVKNLVDSSQASGRNVNVSLDKRKSSFLFKLGLKRKSTSRTFPHKPILRSSSKIRQHSTLNSSYIIPKSDKSDSDSKKTKHVSKIYKSARDTSESEIEISKNISRNNNVTDTPSKGNEMSQNFDNEKGKSINKTHKKVKASKTFSAKNTEIATDISANENEILQNRNSKNKKHVNKIKKISEAVKGSLNDNAKSATDIPVNEIRLSQKFDNERGKRSNNTHENLVVFSTESTENTVDVPSEGNKTMQNLHIKRKSPVSKIYEKLETSRTLSKNIENMDCELNNGGTRNFHSGKNAKNKNKEKQKASETSIRDNQNTDNFLEAETGTISIHKKRKKCANKSHQNLSFKENNNQLVAPCKKKKGNEIRSTNENIPLRRSARQKFPRLALWRNERLLYQIENGGAKIIGIDEGTGEDDAGIKAIQKKYLSKSKKKKNAMYKLKKCTVHDVINKKKVRISLIKHFDAIPWDKGYEGKECLYHIKSLFESKTGTLGFVQIEVNEEKPLQYMPERDICFTLIEGKIEVTIERNAVLMEAKCMFFVPSGVPYSLKNVGTTKALLTFCVGKFDCLKNYS